MKRSLAVAAVTLVACAAFGAVYAYFSPTLNAVTGETEEVRAAARQRVLEYNEDDVEATWHVRRWLRTLR